MLRGNLVELRAIEPSDFPVLTKWLNDASVMVYWGRPGNTVSVEEVAADEARQAARGTSRKYIVQTVEGRPIGQIDYYDLDWQARSAWVSVMIGEPDYWGGGYGTDAMQTLLGYLFKQLGLHRVALTVHANNERAQRSYAKCGFQSEGRLRQWAYFDGSWVDGMLMSVLESDFSG